MKPAPIDCCCFTALSALIESTITRTPAAVVAGAAAAAAAATAASAVTAATTTMGVTTPQEPRHREENAEKCGKI